MYDWVFDYLALSMGDLFCRLFEALLHYHDAAHLPHPFVLVYEHLLVPVKRLRFYDRPWTIEFSLPLLSFDAVPIPQDQLEPALSYGCFHFGQVFSSYFRTVHLLIGSSLLRKKLNVGGCDFVKAKDQRIVVSQD